MSTTVIKTGGGKWILSGQNAFRNGLIILEGTLVMGSNVASDINSPFGVANTLNSPVLGSSASGASGTAALLAAGGVTVDAPFFVSALGGGGASQVAVIGATTGTGGNSVLFGTSDIYLGRDITLQASDGVTATFQTVWRNINKTGAAAVGFTIGSGSNNGTVVLESTLGSAAFVNVVAGTARLSGANNRINTAAPVTIGSSLGAATLDINGLSQTLSYLAFAAGSGSITGGTLRLTGTVATSGTGHTISSAVALDATATFSGTGSLTISGVMSGSNGIAKTGLGTLTLSAANTYTGTTTINDGTLKANNVSAFGSGDIVVNSGGTLDRNGYAISNNIVNNGGIVLA